MPELPRELTDIILDYLHNDKVSLACCALVCRDWIPTSRYHLFSKVHLTTTPSLEHVTKFTACLRASPHIASLIRELFIESGCENMAHVALPLCFLEDLMTTIPSLTRLALHLVVVVFSSDRDNDTITHSSAGPHTHSGASPQTSSIQELYLDGVHWSISSAASTFSSFLAMSPSLQIIQMQGTNILSVDNAIAEFVDVGQPRIQDVDLPIRSISLQSPVQAGHTILYHLSTTSSLTHLTSLAVSTLSWADFVSIGDMVLKGCSTLTSIRLYCGQLGYPHRSTFGLNRTTTDRIWSSLNLKSCRSLRSFSISIPLHADPDMLDPWTSRILLLTMAVLTSYLPATTESITMGIVYDGYDDDPLNTLDRYWGFPLLHGDWELFRESIIQLPLLATFHLYHSVSRDEEDDSHHHSVPDTVQAMLERKLSLPEGILQ